ncbi:MAG: hypothetical protein LBF92_02360 [Synergistaceae bacterium]|jgi:hypothetical protein|nr:hypothetical protein [Synergistaceae bacterium]
MTYSLRKTSGGSLDNSGGTEDVVEGQGTKLEDVYDYTTVKYELLSVKSVAGEEIYLNTSNNEKAIMRNIELRIAADALPANTSVVVSGVIDPPFPSGDWEFVTWPFAVDIDGFSGSSLSISLVIPYRDEQFNHLVITDPSVLKLYVYYDDAWHEGSINNIDTNARRIHAGISKPGIVAIAFPMDSELNSQRTSNAVDLQNIVTRMVRRPDGEIPKEGDILIRKHDSGRWTPGHVGIVTGVSETGETQYVAEANPPLKGDGKVSTHVYGGILGVFGGNTYMGAFYPAGVTDAQRQKAVQWAKGQIGKKYVNMRYFPGSRYGMMHEDFVKGNVEEAFNCTGLVEAAYEYGAGLDIVKSTPASQIWVDIPSEGVCVPLSEVIGNKEYRDALKDKGFWELASEWNLFIFPENNPEEAERRFAEEADLGEALTPAKYYRILNAAASTPDNPDQDFITVTFKVYHNGAPVKDALVSVYLDSGRGYLAGRDRTDANGEFKSAYMPGTHFVEAQNSDNTASSALRQITITSETNVKPIFLESINSGGTTPGNGSTQWYDNYQSAATFTITNADQLAGLAYLVNNGTDFLNKTVYIDRDIYLTGKEWTPIGTHQNLFRGKLDGNGHTIWDMTITRTNSDKHAGLFGAVGAEGFITSLNMAGVNINVSSVSGSRAGSIAGYSAGRINACAFDGSISAAQFAGGVVGATEGGFVASCSTFDRHIDSVSVSALIAGGIVGFDGGDTAISGCRVNGAVFAANEGGNVGSITLRPGVFMSLSGPLAWAGGIAGSGDGEIEECTFSGYVFAELHGSNPYANEVSAAGGVAGCANGIVKNSRSSAYISAYADSGMVMTGGIVGLMNGAGEVSGCEKTAVLSSAGIALAQLPAAWYIRAV